MQGLRARARVGLSLPPSDVGEQRVVLQVDVDPADGTDARGNADLPREKGKVQTRVSHATWRRCSGSAGAAQLLSAPHQSVDHHDGHVEGLARHAHGGLVHLQMWREGEWCLVEVVVLTAAGASACPAASLPRSPLALSNRMSGMMKSRGVKPIAPHCQGEGRGGEVSGRLGQLQAAAAPGPSECKHASSQRRPCASPAPRSLQRRGARIQ